MANVVDLAPGYAVGSIPSRHHRLSRPDIVNADLVPAHFRDFCENLINEVQVPAPVRWSVIPDATVEGAGLVYDRDLNLIRESIRETSPEDVDACTWSVTESRRTGSTPLREGVTLLCEKAGVGNYGHWLVEMLPVVHLMLPEIARWGWKVRLPVASAEMNAVMQASLELLGVPAKQIAFRVPGPEAYERLVILIGLTHHGYFYSPLVVHATEALAANIGPGSGADIWVTRAKASRKLLNEEDIVAELLRRNWTVVDPGNMTLRHQIAVFKGARRIAGVTGAGLTNLVFAPRGTKIVSFMPSQMPDIFYWVLSDLKGHTYREVRCPEAEDHLVSENWGTPIRMELSDVLQNLE
jgi:capsular polysaccharide biosynthesis protein